MFAAHKGRNTQVHCHLPSLSLAWIKKPAISNLKLCVCVNTRSVKTWIYCGTIIQNRSIANYFKRKDTHDLQRPSWDTCREVRAEGVVSAFTWQKQRESQRELFNAGKTKNNKKDQTENMWMTRCIFPPPSSHWGFFFFFPIKAVISSSASPPTKTTHATIPSLLPLLFLAFPLARYIIIYFPFHIRFLS